MSHATYIIGFTPKIDFIRAKQVLNKLSMIFSIQCKEYTLEEDVLDGLKLKEEDGAFFLSNEEGERFWPDASSIQTRLCSESNEINFEVKYIGQAYGKDGSRNAIDRLLKYETFQIVND